MVCCVAAAAQYPDDDAALEEALDALLDNPEFLDLVADEVMFQVRRGDKGGGGGGHQTLVHCSCWKSEWGVGCNSLTSSLGRKNFRIRGYSRLYVGLVHAVRATCAHTAQHRARMLDSLSLTRA